MTDRFGGRVALVTGGASGIGAEIAARFRGEGAAVVTADLAGGDVTVDIRDAGQVRAAVALAVERMGGLDTLVLNAGRPVVGALHDLDEAEWDDGIATNQTSIHRFVRAAWPHLVESQGSITITASIVGVIGSPGQAAYCATKAAAVMLAKCIALDGAKDGIRANAVCPGFTETPMLARWASGQDDPEAARAFATGLHPRGRLGRPRDIADAFVYLASDEADWVTGVAMPIDGGLSIGIWAG